MVIVIGVGIGFMAWVLVPCGLTGFYTVDQNERAVKTVFGRAQRIGTLTTLDDPIAESLRDDEKEHTVSRKSGSSCPGGPYFKWPWEKVHKVSIATETANMAFDPESPKANRERDRAGSRHQGPVEHRPDGPDRLPGLGTKPVCLPVRRGQSDCTRDGLLRFRAAGEDRDLQSPGKTSAKGRADAVSVEGISINDLQKKPPRPERAHGSGMPLLAGPLRDSPRRFS